MSRHLYSLVTATLLASPLVAQAPTISAAQSGARTCTYASCSLRLENGGFSGPRIRTGLDGEATKVGFTGNGIVTAVSAVPAALAEANMGHSASVRGRTIGFVTTSAGLLWMLVAAQSKNDNTRMTSIYGGISVGVIGSLFSAAQMARADQHFSRAVWLYNSALTR
jgi:hypothetical protein